MAFVANARMYGVNSEARAAWAELFAWLTRASGVDLFVMEHAYPAPLSALWRRPDLACAFMCGFPFVQARDRPIPIVAPIPHAGPVPGKPLYVSRLVVSAGSEFRTLEDTFGGRVGYTVTDSHSGYNALRHHLLAYRTPERPTLYRASVGPLITPRRVIEAILAGEIDVGPLDSYALDLMLRHEPDLSRQIRFVASTKPAPIPLLVASSTCTAGVVGALRDALVAFGDAPESADLRDRLGLSGFATVQADDYDQVLHLDDEARAAGYPVPA